MFVHELGGTLYMYEGCISTKGPLATFSGCFSRHFPPILFEFDPRGHMLGPKIDFMPEINPIHYLGVIEGSFVRIPGNLQCLLKQGFTSLRRGNETNCRLKTNRRLILASVISPPLRRVFCSVFPAGSVGSWTQILQCKPTRCKTTCIGHTTTGDGALKRVPEHTAHDRPAYRHLQRLQDGIECDGLALSDFGLARREIATYSLIEPAGPVHLFGMIFVTAHAVVWTDDSPLVPKHDQPNLVYRTRGTRVGRSRRVVDTDFFTFGNGRVGHERLHIEIGNPVMRRLAVARMVGTRYAKTKAATLLVSIADGVEGEFIGEGTALGYQELDCGPDGGRLAISDLGLFELNEALHHDAFAGHKGAHCDEPQTLFLGDEGYSPVRPFLSTIKAAPGFVALASASLLAWFPVSR